MLMLLASASSLGSLAACEDGGPWGCVEDGCPAPELSCAMLAESGACSSLFAELWSVPPADAGGGAVSSRCPRACGRCGRGAPRECTVSRLDARTIHPDALARTLMRAEAPLIIEHAPSTWRGTHWRETRRDGSISEEGDTSSDVGDASSEARGATSEEGDATSEEGDATSEEGYTTSEEGDATSGEGDSSIPEDVLADHGDVALMVVLEGGAYRGEAAPERQMTLSHYRRALAAGELPESAYVFYDVNDTSLPLAAKEFGEADRVEAR